MARPRRWERKDPGPGVEEIVLHSWRYFQEFIDTQVLEFPDYVWRGQRCANWPLESTLARTTRKNSIAQSSKVVEAHLDRFRYAARGRRGLNPSVLQENDWWALGQHHGLSTPLLDWTSSPFAAAYFAFCDEGPNQSPRRAVYGLSKSGTEQLAARVIKAWTGKTPPPGVEFIRPMTDDNPRLVSQGGLFTRVADGVDIKKWLHKYAEPDTAYLYKITIPNADRINCLRSVNRMNIHHLSLFPDLSGSSRYANLALEIQKY